MPTLTVETGVDKHLLEAAPARTWGATAAFPLLRSGDESIVLLQMPVNATRIAGKQILTATLSVPVGLLWVTQTVTIQATAAWPGGASGVTYGTKPAVTGPTANSGATGALAEGARFTIDMLPLIQALADGDPNRGWQLTTSQSTTLSQIRGFESGFDSWVLTIEYVDKPEAPTQVNPEGVVSVSKWVASVDDVDQLSKVQVQVDATPSGTGADYDSGWVSTTTGKVDLSATTANGLPSTAGNAGTFDTDINNWSGSNATLARVTTPVQAGAGALRLTATAGADMSAGPTASAAFMTPVVPGQTVHVEAYTRTASVARSARIDIQWYDASAVLLSTTTGTASNNSTSYALREVSGVAPASAAYYRPRVYVVAAAAAEIHYFDTIKVNTGTTNWTGLSNNTATFQRARVQTINGGISDWSQWFGVERIDKLSIVRDSPSGTTLWDPTPTIVAHLSGAGGTAETRWQVIITEVGNPGKQLYNSGDAITGATLNHTVPLQYKGVKVFAKDGTYDLEIRAWDRVDRVASDGDLSYLRDRTTQTLDVDGAVTAPNSLTVVSTPTTPQTYPKMMLTWARAAAPDWFVVMRDDEYLDTVDPVDYLFSAGVWKWEDETAKPNVTHAYKVRAVTIVGGVNKQSASTSAVNGTASVQGVWIRSRQHGDVLLEGDGIGDFRQVTKRQTFVMPYRDDDVDIITSQGGYRGTYEGAIDSFQSRNVDADRAVLEKIRLDQLTPVRLVWATENRRVRLIDLTVPPHPSIMPSVDRTHSVIFAFHEKPLDVALEG